MHHAMRPWVIDTNCALDLWVFDDLALRPLQRAVCSGQARWLVTPAMRDEFVRVLAYDTLHSALSRRGLSAEAATAHFDRHSESMPPPSAAGVRCTDLDDQVFIDLAVAHGAILVSKDRAVLRMTRALNPLGVQVAAAASVTSFLS